VNVRINLDSPSRKLKPTLPYGATLTEMLSKMNSGVDQLHDNLSYIVNASIVVAKHTLYMQLYGSDQLVVIQPVVGG
jgi:hypothetical protein